MKTRTFSKILGVVLACLIITSIFGGLPSITYAAAFNIGDTVEVYNTGTSGLLVRDSPSGTVIGGKFNGDRGVVLDGPVYSNNYNRWKIHWLDDGLVGWSAEDWLRKVLAPTLSFTSLTPSTITRSTAPYDATLSAGGTNFNNVNRVTFTWSGAASGSATWDKGSSDWNNKVTVNSDTSMTLRPRVVETSPTWSGTVTWEVTLRDTTGATASRSFTVTYTPSPPGSISGYIYESDGTTPIERAMVGVFEYTSPHNYGWISTNADGSYTFTGLATGTYVVRVEANGYAIEWYDGVLDKAEATPVSVVAPNDTSGINFTLEPGASILGHVYESDGTSPIGGAQIDVFDYDSLSGKWVGYETAWTRPDGSYKTSGLPTGTYGVRVKADGYCVEWYDNAYEQIKATLVPVTVPNDTQGIDFILEQPQSLHYFKITEGFGIKYHVTDDYHALDCNAWAVSQYFETGKPHNLDFVFTLIKEGTAGGYFRNSCIGGEVSRIIGGKELTLFYAGYPVGNQTNFYCNLSLPRFFYSGDEWSIGDKKYKVEYEGSQTVNGIEFSDCIRVTIDDSQNTHEYMRGTGYFILARDIGIVKLVFNRTNGTTVLFEYFSHDQLTRHTISGTINKSGVPVEGIIVQIAYANWGTRSVTDSDGAFAVQAYGPDIVLIIGYDKDFDDIIDFDHPNYRFEYWVNNITSDISGIIIDIYFTLAHSVHFESGRYIVELRVDDPNDTIQSISANGPGITGSISLVRGVFYPFFPYTWWSRPHVSLGTTPPPLPLVYHFLIKDKTGATYIVTDAVQSYVEDFATNLSPSNNETVTGELVFSWTGINLPEIRYKIELSDDQGNKIWDSSSNITNTYYVYDGPSLNPGGYQYYVVSWSTYWDSSLASETFRIVAPTTNLLMKYAPVLYLTSKETFFPMTINSMLFESELVFWDIGPMGPIERRLDPPVGIVDLFVHNQATSYLDLIDTDPSRFVQYFYTVYGRQVQSPESNNIVLQYWLFYPFNDWKKEEPWGLFFQHQGDWESVQVILDVATLEPIDTNFAVTYSQHTWKENRRWEQVIKVQDTHPAVFVAEGSHSNWFTLGEHPAGPSDYTSAYRVFHQDGVDPGDIGEVAVTYNLSEISELDFWTQWEGKWGARLQVDSPGNQTRKWNDETHNIWQQPVEWATSPNEGRWFARTDSPVNLHAYDPMGNHTGIGDDGSIEMEIPGTYVYVPSDNNSEIMIIVTSEELRFVVEGTGEGTYGLEATYTEHGRETTFMAGDLPTSIGVVHEYIIDWDALSQGEEGVTLQIDSDGDGEFEHTLASDDELTQNEFLRETAAPMSVFEIDHVKFDFKKKPEDDKVRVRGKLELDLVNGNGVDISEDVTVSIGPLTETFNMAEKGKKGEKWEYKRSKDGEGTIKHMTIDWKKGTLDIYMDKADLAGVTNPVVISIQIGDDFGEETIEMKEKKHHWDYKAG